MNNIEILEELKTEEELYKYIMKKSPNELPLEHEIFAIRNHNFHNLDYAIYVDGYISIDAIIKNIKKQEDLENLIQENKEYEEGKKISQKQEEMIIKVIQEAVEEQIPKEMKNFISKNKIKEIIKKVDDCSTDMAETVVFWLEELLEE